MNLAAAVRFPGSRAPWAALLASLGIFLISAAIGYFALSGLEFMQESEVAGSFDQSLWGIFSQNLGAIMLMYSGVVTLGFSSLLGLGMTSAFVGATMAVAVDHTGWGHVIGATWVYAPIEFGGCVVAAAAGLYPILTTIHRAFSHEEHLKLSSTYLRGMVDSLKLFAVAVAMILTAAAIEAIAIALE